jgi:hypothetical protein
VFTRSSGVWTQQGKKLVGTGFVGRAHRGMSVALSADGNIAIVGGFVEDGAAGIGVLAADRARLHERSTDAGLH